jgi:hypothetical protein
MLDVPGTGVAVKWSIWASGYQANGDGEVPPQLMYEDVEAPTFREACLKAFADNQCFNAERLTHWARRLHSTREECWDPTTDPLARRVYYPYPGSRWTRVTTSRAITITPFVYTARVDVEMDQVALDSAPGQIMGSLVLTGREWIVLVSAGLWKEVLP